MGDKESLLLTNAHGTKIGTWDVLQMQGRLIESFHRQYDS